MNPSVVSILTADHAGELEALRVEVEQLKREVNDLSGVQARADELEAKLYAAHDELGSLRLENTGLRQQLPRKERRGR